MISGAIMFAAFIVVKPLRNSSRIGPIKNEYSNNKKDRLGEPIIKRTITSSDASNDVGLFVLHEREMWKLTWSDPYEDGEISPSYDVRVRGIVDHENLFIAAQDNYDNNGEVNYGETNFKAQGDEPVTIYVRPNSQFEIANDRVKIDVEVFGQNF